MTGKQTLLSHNMTSFLSALRHKTTSKLSPESKQMKTPSRFTFVFVFCIGSVQKNVIPLILIL